MSTIGNLAERVERDLHPTLGWMLPAARLYSIVNNDGEPTVTLAHENEDCYALLEGTDAHLTAMTSDAIVLVTTGWAAPMPNDDDETPPSRHPERRRVRLTVVADADGMASVLRFEDDDDTVLDEGSAHGSLADALNRLMRSARK
jgi:hypothetical protein